MFGARAGRRLAHCRAMQRFERLVDPAAIERFSARYAEYTHVALPVSYLRQGITVGLVRDDGELVGGYALIVRPPYRFAALVPPATLARCPVSLDAPLGEINGVWLAPELRRSPSAVLLWLHFIATAARRSEPVWVYGYNALHDGLRRLYRHIRVGTIYEGPLVTSGPLRSIAHAAVEYTSRTRLALAPALCVGEAWRRCVSAFA